ncbi:MAG: glycosyltransferase family 4 protein [Bacteroidales bacterium]|jgi:hypothetical protein
MNICHLTTTHPANDARIQRERHSSELGCHCTTLFEGIAPGYPKWQHPFKIFDLATRAFARKSEMYHCHEPDALGIALFLKALRGSRVIYDVHEHWPSELPRDLGAPAWLSRIIDPVERWLAQRADAVIVVSESVGHRFPNAIVLPNYPDPLPPQSLDNDIPLRSFSIIGAKLHTYHIQNGLDAVTRLQTHWPETRLTLVGTLASPLPVDAPITYTGYLAQSVIPPVLRQAGVGLVLMSPEYENIRIGLPNRLFSYMAAGIPVIASALPEIERIVAETSCGVLVQPDDIDEIVEAAFWLDEHPTEAREMGERGRQAVASRYNWHAVEDKLYKCLTDLVEKE